VRRVVEPVPGLDFARNRALREARGEVVAFLDDDIVADPGWLDGLREALAEDPEAGIVTGLVLPFALATPAQVTFERRGGFRRGTRKLRYAGDRLPGNPLFPFGSGMFGAGANMAVRREVVLGLGGFDEALDTGPPLPGGGDLDVFTRVLRAGHPLVYEPRMLVFHRHRPERAALRRQYRSWGEGFMAYVAKTHAADPAGRERLRALVAWWVRAQARELARAALGRSWGPPGYVLEETAGGIAGLAGGYARSRRRSEALRRAHA
jgi:GT2 family glycosyltransferase